MYKNVGGIDKIARIVIGAVILGVSIYYGSWWGIIGAIVLGTGLINRCACYYPLGISTCKIDAEKK